MAERGVPERAVVRRGVTVGMAGIRTPHRAALLRPDGGGAPVKISWTGQRITRMVFASGKTIEFTS